MMVSPPANIASIIVSPQANMDSMIVSLQDNNASMIVCPQDNVHFTPIKEYISVGKLPENPKEKEKGTIFTECIQTTHIDIDKGAF